MAKLKITIEIDDTDQKILKDGTLDINEWCQNAVIGKINHCWKQMQTSWTSRLINDSSFTDSIPSNKTDFVNLVTSRSEYKDCAERNKKPEK